jgi:hypothetical protein
MNGGSGGTGIRFCPPWFDDSKRANELRLLVAGAAKKYGDNIEDTLFPIRTFEFVRSTGYALEDGQHLWDLRVQVLISPGKIQASPAIIRLCPEQFDPTLFTRDSVVSNLSGRPPSIQFMRSPWARNETDQTSVLEACGVEAARLDDMLTACVRWCERAWKFTRPISSPQSAQPI